jgi:hypothetical protein
MLDAGDCPNNGGSVFTEIGPVEIAAPRDTDSTFEPQIVKSASAG